MGDGEGRGNGRHHDFLRAESLFLPRKETPPPALVKLEVVHHPVIIARTTKRADLQGAQL